MVRLGESKGACRCTGWREGWECGGCVGVVVKKVGITVGSVTVGGGVRGEDAG